MSIASVKHLTKDHVQIKIAVNYTITTFNIADRDIEAIIVDVNGEEAIRLKIAAPAAHQTISIETTETGVDIKYKDKS